MVLNHLSGISGQSSLRSRFAVALTVVITSILVVFSAVVITYNSRSLESRLYRQLEKISVFSMETLSIALWQYNYDYIKEYIASLSLYEDVVYAAVLIKGKPVAQFKRPEYEKTFTGFKNASGFITTKQAIVHDQVPVGQLQLVVSRSGIKQLVVNTSLVSIIVLILMNLAVFGTNYFLTHKYIFKPISRLEKSVKQVALGDLNTPIKVEGNDEIAQLGGSFNHMLLNLKKLTASRDELNLQIIERKAAEDKIKNALREKEVLFKEIHHRVKNNMQIIQSLLSLQAGQAGDEAFSALLADSNSRIQSMSLIHETLYQSENVANLDIRRYFNEIMTYLFNIYSRPDLEVRIHMDIQELDLDMDQGIACGLILNEAITNTFKYAFAGTDRGQIRVSLKPAGGCRAVFTIKDDGCGFPLDMDAESRDNLGLKIIDILARGQLKGRMEKENNNGAVFKITFPLIT